MLTRRDCTRHGATARLSSGTETTAAGLRLAAIQRPERGHARGRAASQGPHRGWAEVVSAVHGLMWTGIAAERTPPFSKCARGCRWCRTHTCKHFSVAHTRANTLVLHTHAQTLAFLRTSGAPSSRLPVDQHQAARRPSEASFVCRGKKGSGGGHFRRRWSACSSGGNAIYGMQAPPPAHTGLENRVSKGERRAHQRTQHRQLCSLACRDEMSTLESYHAAVGWRWTASAMHRRRARRLRAYTIGT